MIRAVPLLLLLLLLLLTAPASAETIRIGTEAGYPPYMTRDAAGVLSGFDKDVGDAVCARLGAECIWIEAAFADLLPGLVAGRFDIVIAALAASPERRRIVDFTRSYRTEGPNIGAFAGLSPGLLPEDARIGVPSGTIHEAHLRDTGRTFRSYPSFDAVLGALLRGEIDVAFAATGMLRQAFETRLPQLRLLSEEEIDGWETAIAVRRHRGKLRDRIDAVLDDLWRDGTIPALEARWFVDGRPT